MQDTNVQNLIINKLTKAQYEGIASPSDTELYLIPDDSSGGATRNIGEIVSSTIPLTDASLHLLDGALIQGSGIYSAFVDYIAGLVSTYPSVFTTESAWQTSVTTYGVCGKFVYDSTNNTVRLPKVTGILEGTTDVNALGDLVQAGLPQHTHTRGSMNITGREGDPIGYGVNNTQGCFYTSGRNDGIATTSQLDYDGAYHYFDASRSWTGSTSNANYTSTVNASSTVQPQTIKAFYYIVIATSTKTDIQVDIDDIATDLNGKVDTDLTNVTDTAKVLMSGMSMPSNKYVNLTLGATGTTYKAPANGWVVLVKKTNGTNQYAALRGKLNSQISANPSNYQIEMYIAVSKGENFTCNYSAGGTTDKFRFYYAVGSESEAN